MMQRGHGVEQVGHVRDACLEPGNGFVIRRVGMAEGGNHSACDETSDDVATARQFRRDGHHLQVLAQQGLDMVQRPVPTAPQGSPAGSCRVSSQK